MINNTIQGVPITVQGRSQSLSVESQDMNLFPFDAFNFDDSNTTDTPVLEMKDPWVFDVGEISVDKITNFDAQVRTIAETDEINAAIADIEAALQSGYTSWFYDGTPTLLNEPAVNWTDDATKDIHLGDVYYDGLNGKAYHFVSPSTGVYEWKEWVDSGVTIALQAASEAQDTADGKRRVFTSTPVVPYDIGDLWSRGETLGVWVATTAKESFETYDVADWEKTSDATNDDALNNFVDTTYTQFVQDVESSFADILTGNAFLESHFERISREIQNIDEEHQFSMSQITVGQGQIDLRVGAVEEETQNLNLAYITLDSTVGNNIVNIGTLTEDLVATNSELGTVSSSVLTLQSDLNSAEATIEAHTGSISTNTLDIGTNATNIGTNASDITEQAQQLLWNTDNIDSVMNDLTTVELTVASHNSAIFELETNVTNATAAIGVNTSTIATVDGKVATNGEAISDNTTALGDISLTISDQSSSILTLETNYGNAIADISTNTSNIAVLNNSVTGWSTVIDEQSDAILVLETGLGTAEGQIETNVTNISTNITNITTNATDIGTLDETVTNNASSIITLQSDLTTAEIDISVAYTTAVAKNRVFTVEPVPPYDLGDLWNRGETLGIWGAIVAQDDEGTFSIDDWVRTTDKAKVFTEEPTVPYNIGDLWARGESLGVWSAIVAKSDTETYDIADWSITTDATNDDLAKQKARVFITEPTAPYYVGDLYTVDATSDTLQCITERLTGDYDVTEWTSVDTRTAGHNTAFINLGVDPAGSDITISADHITLDGTVNLDDTMTVVDGEVEISGNLTVENALREFTVKIDQNGMKATNNTAGVVHSTPNVEFPSLTFLGHQYSQSASSYNTATGSTNKSLGYLYASESTTIPITVTSSQYSYSPDAVSGTCTITFGIGSPYILVPVKTYVFPLDLSEVRYLGSPRVSLSQDVLLDIPSHIAGVLRFSCVYEFLNSSGDAVPSPVTDCTCETGLAISYII